jgi:hypothetical protein
MCCYELMKEENGTDEREHIVPMAPTTVGKKYSFAIIYIYIYIYISCLMDVTACSFSITEECMLPV